MKRVLSIVLLAVSLPCAAAEPSLDLGGIGDLVAEKLKESKAATLVSLDAKVAGALYLPIWTFHNADDTADYLELGAGGQLREGGKGLPLVSAAVNLPALSARVWSSQWAQQHLRRTKFPPIWVGPFVLLPMPGEAWTIKSSVGGMVSVRFGGAAK